MTWCGEEMKTRSSWRRIKAVSASRDIVPHSLTWKYISGLFRMSGPYNAQKADPLVNSGHWKIFDQKKTSGLWITGGASGAKSLIFILASNFTVYQYEQERTKLLISGVANNWPRVQWRGRAGSRVWGVNESINLCGRTQWMLSSILVFTSI